MSEHRVIVCLGSNVACKTANIRRALHLLASHYHVVGIGKEVESPDVTGRGEPYVNLTVECEVGSTIDELNAFLSSLENELGRIAESKSSGVMPLDADIVVWDETVISPRDYQAPYFTKPERLACFN